MADSFCLPVMALPQTTHSYSVQEYYRLEQEDDYKSEYYAGEIFAMAGGSPRHSLISLNLAAELRQRLKGKPCAPYEGNLRLRVRATGLVTYPDAAVYCGPLEIDPEDAARQTATNPTLVVEVLSKSTEAYDRGKKAEHYRRIPSLQGYLLVAQHEPHVELFLRQPNGHWELSEASGLESVIAIPCLDLSLPLAEIYDRVEFGEEE